MEQHTILKQGAKEYRRWSDRVLTVDTENGFAFLSEKGKPHNTTHHKLYVQCVQTWPNYKPRYITEDARSREAMLTIRIRGLAIAPEKDDKERIADSREGSPSLRPSRTRTAPLSGSATPQRPSMQSSFTVPPAGLSPEKAAPLDGTPLPQGNGVRLPCESPSDDASSPSSPLSSGTASTPTSQLNKPDPFDKAHREWWIIRVTSLTQLARVLLSFQHMKPEKFNAHQLLSPAKACLVADKAADF